MNNNLKSSFVRINNHLLHIVEDLHELQYITHPSNAGKTSSFGSHSAVVKYSEPLSYVHVHEL